MLLVIKYSLFTAIAITINVLCQDVVNRLYHGQFDLYASMLAGTLAGLVVKYILDRKYIFLFQTKSILQDAQKFILYSIMGVVTTCVFWGAEMTFDYAFHTLLMRYVGAVIGLTTGYYIKYHLDKRFVFVEYA
ncbi:MAG: GtrA family protein [Syntrophobacteraceae bacterium]|jgi:putative flippase GtrA